MFFLKIFTFTLFCALFLSGCATSEPQSGIVAAQPQADETTLSRRAEELSQVLAPCKVRGIGLYPGELRDVRIEDPQNFMALLEKFGFNRIYLYFDSPEPLRFAWLPQLLEAAGNAGLPVDAILPESAYVSERRGNFIVRHFKSGGISLEEMLRELHRFEERHPALPKFAGVTILAEPHLFTLANIHRPKDLIYAWGPNTFGEGLDNDMLMKLTLKKLENLLPAAETTPVTIGIPDFYQELVTDGKVTVGRVSDFQKLAPRTMIRDSGNKPSEVIETVANELREGKPGSILVGINLAEHTAVSSGALRRRNWKDFINSLSYVIAGWRAYPSFDGVVLGPFHLIETLHEEK